MFPFYTRIMYFCLYFLATTLLATSLAQSNQLDIMKITNVQFPNSGSYAALANATLDTDIPAFTLCYRMLIDSYNDGLFSPFYAFPALSDRKCWKCGIGSEGFMGGNLYFVRNIPGGGLANQQFPRYHRYNMARDIPISTWTHICFSYSSITQKLLSYQDGLKVFNFTFGDEKEDPLPPDTFSDIRIAANMRGLMGDLQIYSNFFNEDDTGCSLMILGKYQIPTLARKQSVSFKWCHLLRYPSPFWYLGSKIFSCGATL